jgi:predicted MPP superfamily phosphohydrolase
MLRRRFLAAAGAAMGAALGTDAFLVEPHRIQVSRHQLPVSGLPTQLEGLRIAEVADLHLPACRRQAEAVAELLAAERPDVVLHTGDAVEVLDGVPILSALAPALRGTAASGAVLGNWEHRDERVARATRAAWERAGVPPLDNSHTTLHVGDAVLALVGLADLLLARPDLEAARHDIPVGAVEVWFGHEPELADRTSASTPRPALFLCGHTHGGQILLPGVPAFTPAGSGRYIAGWYRDAAVPLYVSRGIGTAEVRARFRCPPELPLFQLTRA